MKYKSRSNTYANSSGTLTLDASTLEGRSYSWYAISKKIGGVVVLNTFRYSATTAKHVRAIEAQLINLGVREMVAIEAPRGLNDLASAKELYEAKIESLYAAMGPRSKPAKNVERHAAIRILEQKLKLVSSLEVAHA